MTEHTALPFIYEYPNLIVTSEGHVIARIELTEWAEVDTRFIITACNNHEPMLEALKLAMADIERTGYIGIPHVMKMDEAIRTAKV